MNDIVWLTMRRMRGPLVIMILVYSLSVFGMVLISGQDADGNALRVGFLDAAYFVAIMATTIGFGEIPTTFTGAQRLFVYIVLSPMSLPGSTPSVPSSVCWSTRSFGQYWPAPDSIAGCAACGRTFTWSAALATPAG